jgi:N-acetylglucosaminyldiphosphoundecaprenol N-acetyl-beta-D-mannosaminyltransferase
MAETVAAVERMIQAGSVHQHVVVNASKVVQADRDPTLREIINACDLVNADGQPIVWASRFLGRPLPERVTGIDLMLRLLALAASREYSVYLLGARREVVAAVAERAVVEHPGLRIAGWRDGFWSAAEEDVVVADIAHRTRRVPGTRRDSASRIHPPAPARRSRWR